MKRFFLILLVFLLSLDLAGCDTVARKFTRKRKRETIRPVFYREGMDNTRPHIDLYMSHYTYWKSWNDELAANAGRNSKKDRMAAAGALSHLADMRKNLIEEKAKELDVYIAEVSEITQEMLQVGSGSAARLGRLKGRLSTVGARIVRDFYHKKVREYILPD